MNLVKKFFLILVLLVVIAGSFWLSFVLGKKMLVPTKTLPPKLIPSQIEFVTSESQPKISIEVETSIPKNTKTKVVKEKPKVVATKPKTKVVARVGPYKVQAGAFGIYNNAKTQSANLKKKGFNASIVKSGKYWLVYAGSFFSKSSANNLVASLKAKGFEAVVRRR